MKNQFKKSLSLIMAVLMLMSCWVWVAPTEAEAADVNTQYYVIFKTNVKDTGNENSSSVTINYKYSNGTGSSSSVSKSYGQQGWSGDNVVIYEGYINGFPTSVSFTFKIDSTRSERHENYQLLVGKDKASCTTNVIPLDSYTYKGDYTYTKSVNADAYPILSEGGGSLSAESVDLGKVGTSTNATSTLTLSGFKDQYGVAWGDISYGYSMNAGDGVTIGSHASISKSSNTATVTVKPSFQTLFPGKSSAKINIPWTAATRTGTAVLTVNFPTYKITFDSNGGKIGTSDADAQDKIEVTSNKMNYGSVIGKSPAYRTKDGFDFEGFYADKNADATGLSASFTGTKFTDDETTVPAQGDVTYYAAWKAKPITATFVTADNQLIGTVEGRYNNYLTNTNMYNGLNGLNAAVKAAYSGSTIKFDGNNAPVYKDGSSSYTFSHWKIIKGYDNAIVDKDHTATLKGDVTFQAVYTKSDAKKYAVKFYDGNGNVINDASNKTDYKYRDNVIMPSTEPSKAQDDKYNYEFIGWANNIGAKYYAVDENDIDESGATIFYTSKDAAEFTVRGDASYVPVFRMIPREYNVTFKYKVDGGADETLTVPGYHLDDAITLPESIKDNYTNDGYRYFVTGWKVGTDYLPKALDTIKVNGDVTLTAVYGKNEAAKYTINFYDIDKNLINADNNIFEHNSLVAAPVVGKDGVIPQVIERGNSRYTFTGWSPEVNTTATADADYYATYSKKDYADIYFYNYDGTLIYSAAGKENEYFVGASIPEYNEADYSIPEKAEDAVGTYRFIGWADGEGNTVVPGTDNFTGTTYLYAQFETEYKNYTVKFLNDDDSVILEKTYHYATEIEIPANPQKAADETYNYEFRAWTPDVSVVCYGDATYTATYRRTYNYYDVTWLNTDKTHYSSSKYIYNAKIQPANTDNIKKEGNNPAGYDAPKIGYKWVFSHWVQCDANGNDILVNGEQVKFTRGMKMGTEALYFYPVFVEEANVLTVTFMNEDRTTKLGEAEIPYGENIDDYSASFEEKASKTPDADKHYNIERWVDANGADVSTISKNITVYPIYVEEAHSFDIDNVVKYPTCTETGLVDLKCINETCGYIDRNVVADIIADDIAPTGQITVYGKNIDGVTYVGPDTKLVVSAEDLGMMSMPWNLDAEISRGVYEIQYYVSENEIRDLTGVNDEDWTTVYNSANVKADVLKAVLKDKGISEEAYNTTLSAIKKAEIDNEANAIFATYKANATGIVSNLEFEDGKEYIIYIRVSDVDPDAAGDKYESNYAYFDSGKLYYDVTAPTIIVSGEGYGSKFCSAATVTVTDTTADATKDNAVTVTLDGEEIALTDGKFVCNEKGVYTVTAVDMNGNKTSKTFEVNGGHNSSKTYKINATCENAGSEYKACSICGIKTEETVIPAKGHSYTTSYTEKAATCTADGYRTYACDNNCGQKLIINAKSDAAEIAKATKEVDGKWVSLTADDLKHLTATGEHTYAKVKDENGADTTEDAWVIDKAATCTVEGSKHKDCTVCGILGRVTEAIALDTVNGHKFYRAEVTDENQPTCTQSGKKTKTCRYCGYVEDVEVIAALGHTDGEYEVTVAPTCEATGSKDLLCATCGEVIKTEVIDALGHSYKATGEVYKGEDGKYYQKYVCRNDETHTKSEVVEGYEPPVAATVKFYNGEAEFATINGNVGDTISAADVAGKPVKAEDATYKYTFAYWATKNADGSYTEVKFPIDVKGDAAYYAVYTEKYINYTITYYTGDYPVVTEYKKTGYLHNGETVALADGPAKAETKTQTFEFAGWALAVDATDDEGNATKKLQVIEGNEVVIDGANINVYATYTATTKQYAITFAYSKSDIISSFLVDAGSTVGNTDEADVKFETVPEKAHDAKVHYVFTGWNRADKATKLITVESNVYTTPNFEAVVHDFAKSLKTAATCGADAVYTYTCNDCGCTYEKAEANTALEHVWSDAVLDEETGKYVKVCSLCGETTDETSKYTAYFYLSEEDMAGDKAYDKAMLIEWGKTIPSTDLPADPKKATDSTNTYTFKHWVRVGTEETYTKDELAKLVIKADEKFVAVFDATVREYNVYFVYEGDTSNVISYKKNVKAGSDVTFEGTTAPTKAYNDSYHYTFKGWKDYEAGKLNITVEDVQSDVYVYAQFTATKHTYDAGVEVDKATCTQAPGYKYTCTGCERNFTRSTGKPLDHTWVEVDRREATANKDGYIKYKCETCDNTKEETLKYESNAATVSVTVLCNGVADSGKQVIVMNTVTGETKFVTTNANGVATTEGIKGESYAAWVVIDGVQIQVELNEDSKGNFSATYSYEVADTDCTCACHRTNVWGTIFRFFHKIIKMFTGEFKCCGNPDELYGE